MGPQATRPEDVLFERADGDITHYICQSGDELTEKTFDGGMGPTLTVGSAKGGTHGTYVLLGDNRAIYCLGDGNTLKDFEYDAEEWEWTEGRLAQSGVMSAPATEIAAVNTHQNYVEIFFQGPSGDLQSIFTSGGGAWQASKTLPQTKPLQGASISAIEVNGFVHVFYAHQDCSIHELVLEKGEWSDTKVPCTDGNSPKSNITAYAEGAGYSLQFCDAEGTVFALADGELAVVGKVTKDGFKKSSDAEGNKLGPRVRKPIPLVR